MTIELPIEDVAHSGIATIPFGNPAFLTLRSAGSMRDAAARGAVLERLAVNPARLCVVRQIHSRTVHTAEALLAAGSIEGASVPTEGDGIVSGPDGPWLAVAVADCMPIFLSDRRTGAYGLLHSGWRGTGILREAVTLMERSYGTRSGDLVALFGPCISADSYAVDAARAREFSVWGADAVVHRGDQAYLDMRAANRSIADELGIRTVTVNHCTYRTPQLGSYRREGSDRYTSMLALVGPVARA